MAIPRRAWKRRLGRCALGVGIAVVAGWILSVLLVFLVGVWETLVADATGSAWSAAIIFGFVGGILVAPAAFLMGVPIWLVADRHGLTRAASGAVAGAVVGVIVSLAAPFLIVILPFVGALSGFLAVRYTNRILPKTWS